ncbi:MAG: glycerol-3-phosphate 1-O-acyltransferase PlsY [Gemmatimonadales bacterium]|nr:glycerol-3-phosphate 1-O-acyltransferase PlsY [Gemmatimonadales bacterium]
MPLAAGDTDWGALPLLPMLAVFGASYLVGAFPTSYLAGRLVRGIDLREHGSRNLGATNVYRVLGWRTAIPVAAVDILKGALPVWLFAPRVSDGTAFAMVCGAWAIAGHVWSLFVRFKGGKGVATAAGVFFAITPVAMSLSVALWAALVFLTGYVSLGSITAASLFPVFVWWRYPAARSLVWVDVLVAAGIIWFHRANIGRLLNGTENRFGRRGAAAARG